MSVWTDFGFRESPYGTDPIPMTQDGEYLLVGRDEELDELKAFLTSSTLHPTIEGDNGVGKTSLVSVASYRLMQDFANGDAAEALIPLPEPFQLVPSDTDKTFAAKVLYQVAHAFIEHHDLLVRRGLNAPSTGSIDQWLNAPLFRSGGVEVNVLGSGGSISKGVEPNSSGGFTEAGFAAIITQWLKECFPTRQSGGFVAIIDNLELLETSKTTRALLESMRDTVLNLTGIRWVLCGARGIVRTGASSQRLEGRLLAPMELLPISDENVATAMIRRAEVYRIDSDAIAPVGPDGFRYLYDVLNFNLRNTLKYCEDFSFWLRKNLPEEKSEMEYLRLLKSWLKNQADKHNSDTALGDRAWKVFDKLSAGGGSVSPSQFEDFDFNSYPAMRPHLKALEDNQLVQSSVDDTDQRRKTIVMTPRAWLVYFARNGYVVPGAETVRELDSADEAQV